MSNKLALIIGNSHYQDPNLAKLAAPALDAIDLAATFRPPLVSADLPTNPHRNGAVSDFVRAVTLDRQDWL